MLSALADSLYIIYQKRLIVKRFSESFLKKFSSKNAYKLWLEGLAAASAAGQLDYYSKWSYFCQWGFSGFLTNFESDFWVRCMLGICCAMATSCRGGCLHPPAGALRQKTALAGRRGRRPLRLGRLPDAGVGCAGGIYAAPTGEPLGG